MVNLLTVQVVIYFKVTTRLRTWIMSTIIWTRNNDAVASIETRNAWPLLTVETEVNGDSKSTNESGLWLVRWACRAGTRDFCSVLEALVSPVQNIFDTISVPVSPSPSKLGRQPCWVACLLVCVSGVISAHFAFFKTQLCSMHYNIYL